MSTDNTISVAALVSANRIVINHNEVNTGPVGSIVYINPGDARLDYDYQRSLNIPHATKIAQRFSYSNMKVPTGYRMPNGSILITDGQHTCVAAFAAKVDKIPVLVQELPAGLNREEAVAIQSKQFIEINRSNKPVSKYDIYRNLLIQKDPATVAMAAACERTGVIPSPTTKSTSARPGSMSHIHNLQVAWNQIGPKPTEQAMRFVRQYFPNDAVNGRFFLGLARFFQRFNESKARGLVGAQYDEALIVRAITCYGGLATLDEVQNFIDDESSNTNKNTKTGLDVWVAKTIRYLNNEFINQDKTHPNYLKALV